MTMDHRPTMLVRLVALFGLLAALAASPTARAQSDWEHYADPVAGYEIDLPVGLLGSRESEGGLIRLHDDMFEVVLEVYGGVNRDDLSLSAFIDFLAEADRIAEITYRTGGRTWFVISGYYRRADAEPRPLIFYAKFMFSPDLGRFAAFEISYPQALKVDLDPMVERLEASLRAPD